mmetsp:Transcript_36163/g.82440  ORF Transcript_36163/g.82440 Transcript_36163/m.82440 type:complete len:375 (+) Transcript_36163:12-1136(+)|eukprot:CAMPEP_0114558794 /NCGR_PEP_ID=MMETSP0114-20121206/10576_1 /TAXON_ID=31324 /ORGANISM="Goniomonas sp, Strain m" /LENGTH=374 /DNA_ID=CAMNT_0001744217 /DNA_START=17 /DNA_END=1141 /DNA_ORIENTATION=+
MLRLLLTAGIVCAALADSTCVDCPEYHALSAKDKSDVLWEKITNSSYSKPFPNDWYSSLEMLKLFTESMDEPFDRFSDEFPAGRLRLIHSLGAIAKVSFVSANSSYTGMFQGADYGFARLSLARKPDPFAPGMAVKLLRDSSYSANIICMYGLDGQTSYNFFENQFKTWIADPTEASLKVLLKRFETGALNATHLAVDGLATATQTGEMVPNPSAPGALYFVPNPALVFGDDPHDFRDDLVSLPSGTKLYDVIATTTPCLCSGQPCNNVSDCADTVRVGELVMQSEFVASQWGDQGIFFQHYRHTKKEVRTCAYSVPLSDDYCVRMAGDHDKMCWSGDADCPSVPHSDPPVATKGCPMGDMLRRLREAASIALD